MLRLTLRRREVRKLVLPRLPPRAALSTAAMTAHVAARVLNVPLNASAAQVKQAFIVLAHETHPDRGGSAAAFARVREAHDTLRQRTRRPAASHNDKAPPDEGAFSFGELGLAGMVRAGRLQAALQYWQALLAGGGAVDHDTVIGAVELYTALPSAGGLQAAAGHFKDLALEGRFSGGGRLTSAALLTHEQGGTGVSTGSGGVAASGPGGPTPRVRRPDGVHTRGRAVPAARRGHAAHVVAGWDAWGGAPTPGPRPEAGASQSSAEAGASVAPVRGPGLWEGGDTASGARAAYDELLWAAAEAEDMGVVLSAIEDMADLGIKPSLALCEEKLFTFFPSPQREGGGGSTR